MTHQTHNPLAKHFRQPALYLKLPSQGKWYPAGAVDLPVTGEIPVYPMTAKDEITMKTPDAILNGSSTVQVIQSCCPSIKDPWKMPTVDMDPVLIAIRIATYGNHLDFTAVCPHCGTANEHGLDLQFMLGKVNPPNWSEPILTDGLTITLKPQAYEDYTKSSMLNYEEQRLLKIVSDQNMSDEDKSKLFDEMFKKILDLGISQVGKSIESIKTSEGTVVTEQEFIQEFLNNCGREIWEQIKDKLTNLKKQNAFNEVSITCSNIECGKDFITPFVFEQTNFFA